MLIQMHHHTVPRHRAVNPLHVASAWHFLEADPSSIKPLSHENSSILGNVVADPRMLPFSGAHSLPQSTAKLITTSCHKGALYGIHDTERIIRFTASCNVLQQNKPITFHSRIVRQMHIAELFKVKLCYILINCRVLSVRPAP